ncbi:hypothetical protein VTH82DRAFT_6619 [Thermothelomyces myriococcoides]
MDRRKLLFRSLAVNDGKSPGPCLTGSAELERENDQGRASQDKDAVSAGQSLSVSVVCEPSDDEDLELDDDELVLAAFRLVGCIKPPGHGDKAIAHTKRPFIPTDNFRNFIMLLLFIAPADAQEDPPVHSSRLSVDEGQTLNETASYVLSAFLDAEQAPGVDLSRFLALTPVLMPYMFDSLGTLFERFLFTGNPAPPRRTDEQHHTINMLREPINPVQETGGSIMNLNVLSQISLFIPSSSLVRKLRLLYSGDEDGFSMGGFESKVFNWRAPTIMLVTGTRFPEEALHAPSGPASNFLSALPSRRLPPDNTNRDARGGLIYGVYLNQPWKHTYKEPFGDEETILFQLQPVHDVFRASTLNKNYASFTKLSAPYPIGRNIVRLPPSTT